MNTQYTDGQRVRLPIDAIRTDRGTQSRKQANPKTIDEYAALMREGVEFDPVVVFWTPDKEHVLSQGFHRLPAAIKSGRGDIDAIIRIGTLADAKWDSAGSNKHGLRRTADDYAQAVALALSARPKASDREIGQHLGIDHKTVGKYRPTTGEASPVETRVGRDGIERKLPVRKPEAEKPADKPPTKPNGKPLTTVKRDGDEGPADDVPAVEREAPAEQPLKEALFNGEPDTGEPAFDLPGDSSRAAAALQKLIESWPKKFWPTLAGILRNALERIER